MKMDMEMDVCIGIKIEKMKEYKVTDRLPDNGIICMCFGNKTYCCSEDMEEKEWHKVKFKFVVSMYKLKNNIPEDPEESILDKYEIIETWECLEDIPAHVIGVTKWATL